MALDEAAELFMPVTDGGQLKRTAKWPRPDSHEAARRVCGPCPVLEKCLAGALIEDAWTFRGGLSPEERAALGGVREAQSRKRPVYVTPEQVWNRLVDSGMDVVVIERVVEQHRERLARSEELRTAAGVPEPGARWWRTEWRSLPPPSAG